MAAGIIMRNTEDAARINRQKWTYIRARLTDMFPLTGTQDEHTFDRYAGN